MAAAVRRPPIPLRIRLYVGMAAGAAALLLPASLLATGLGLSVTATGEAVILAALITVA